ncbi:MAG: hypothetical protein Ct9H90mP9_0740 [Pseudomonadota bacterium]|nr:MAG: hypothetical protein Ct9H90mP9_0740 [Pseudomonadota bacterium]
MNNTPARGVPEKLGQNQQNFPQWSKREICPNPAGPRLRPDGHGEKADQQIHHESASDDEGQPTPKDFKSSARLNFDCAAATEGMSRAKTPISSSPWETRDHPSAEAQISGLPHACPLNGKRTGKSVLVLPGPKPRETGAKIFMNRIPEYSCAFPTLHTKKPECRPERCKPQKKSIRHSSRSSNRCRC